MILKTSASLRQPRKTKSIFTILTFAMLAVSAPANSADIPVPTGQQSFTYDVITEPVLNVTPSQAKPVGIGTLATGGDTLSIQIGFNQFSENVDIYFGYEISSDPGNIYILKPDNTFQNLSAGLLPWENNVRSVNTLLFGNVHKSVLPVGTYTVYLLVTPGDAEDLFSYYLWKTSFEILPVTEVEQGDIYVDIYNPEKTCDGTTLFADLHDSQKPRIIEVNMEGNVIWEYLLPEELKQYINPGLDVELLANNNVLFVLPLKGVYEIDRSGNIVWKHEDDEISHDADRLENGNTLYVFGGNDRKTDPQVKEVDPNGQIVWSWYAKNDFDVDPYSDIKRGGWTHVNAVTRLDDGNTMINLRNFSLTTIVSPDGTVIKNIDWASISGATKSDPHEPEVQSNGNILVALQNDSPYQGVEIDPSGAVVWTYTRAGLRTTRDCDRLPNGNTLLVGVLKGEDESVIFEVTPAGEIVWQLKLKDTPVGDSPGWFYKAERTCHGG